MTQNEELRCPQCGANIYYTDSECLSCGAKLDEGRLAEAEPTAPLEVELGPPAVGPDYRTSPVHTRPWDPAAMAVEAGFWGKLQRGWIFLKQSMIMWTRDKDLLIPSALSVVTLVAFYALCYGILRLTGVWDTIGASEDGRGLIWWVIMLPIVLIAYIITYFYTAMTVNLIDTHLRGRDARLGEAYLDALKNLGALVQLAVISTIVGVLTSAIRGKGRSTIRRVAAEAVEHAWQAATYLMLPIIIIEDSRLREAMSRARDLHSKRLSDVIVAEVGVTLVNKVISSVIVLIAVVAGVGLYLVSPALLVLAILIALALISLAMVFTAYLRTAYYTCLYLWAAAAEEAKQPVAAPEPLAAAVA